jgi:hypothetical protein
MNRPAGTEKAHSWKATNDTTYPLGAQHSLVAGNPPLDGVGEWRKLARLDRRRSCSWETLERLQFDITVARS